jgi:hypothetical protein
MVLVNEKVVDMVAGDSATEPDESGLSTYIQSLETFARPARELVVRLGTA